MMKTQDLRQQKRKYHRVPYVNQRVLSSLGFAEKVLTNTSTIINSSNKGFKLCDQSELVISMSQNYQQKEFRNFFQLAWFRSMSTAYRGNHPNLLVCSEPFRHAVLPNFLTSDKLQDLVAEVESLSFNEKNNDLYKFKQTDDLKNVQLPCISALRHLLYGPIREWLAELTAIPLNNNVDISSSAYGYTDNLLCHDDELEGRRIAFILYLVPDWDKSDGGSLDIFNITGRGEPLTVVKQIYPRLNSFAFFEVSPRSFHQVAEVLSKTKVRLSVNGWFHGPPISSCKQPKHFSIVYSPPISVEEDIRSNFEIGNEVLLNHFFKQNKYMQLCHEFCNGSHLKWIWKGPPNHCHYQQAMYCSLPETIKEYVSLMKSEAIFLILSQLTGLKLHRLAGSNGDNSEEEICVSDVSQERQIMSHCISSLYVKEKEYDSVGFESKVNIIGPETLKEKWIPYLDDDSPKINVVDDYLAEAYVEVRKWQWGSYSLITDDDKAAGGECALDALLFCNCSQEWDEDCGGYTTYFSHADDFTTVVPGPNSLALSYRDSEVVKFTKYINCKSHSVNSNSVFYEIMYQYRQIKNK